MLTIENGISNDVNTSIPTGWGLCSLEEVCDIRNKIHVDSELYVGLENIGQGDNALISRGNTKDFKSTKNTFKKGDILYGKLRPLLNKAYLATEDGYCSTDILPLRVNDNISAEFLLRVLTDKRFLSFAVATSNGTKMPRTNWADMRDFKVLLPPSQEQRKIASIISKEDELIQKTDQIIEQTQRLKKGLMQKLLTKGIGHRTYQKLTLFPSYLSTMIPEEWSIVKFGDVTKRITYGFTNPMPHVEEGPWLITAKDVKHGKINYVTAEKTTSQAYKQLLSDKSRPRLGTVLITKDGTLGEVGIVDRENICINQSVASLEPNETISSEFLALCLQSPITKRIIEAYSPSTTIKHISITDLAEWKFGLPPLKEQKRIISVLIDVDSYVTNYYQTKSKLQNIKQGLMQKLLTGKIRVMT
ncbi:MAG: restriction endonuclease subunit S [Nitrososphaeraceae archaeon]